MAVYTHIEWCHHTCSPWYGCTKVSPGCANCYAAAGSKRNPASFGVWGPNGKRRVLAEASWHKFRAWDRDARDAGERRRVFPSWCDPFEDWDGPMVNSAGERLWVAYVGNQLRWVPGPDGDDWNYEAQDVRPLTMADVRARFFRTILATPHLDYLLLTKRPENIQRLWPFGPEFTGPGEAEWPNLWLGASVEDQASADARLDHLIGIDARVRFVSYEPALGRVDFRRWIDRRWPAGEQPACGHDASRSCSHIDSCFEAGQCDGPFLDWIICGGESGPGARPMHPDYARSARDQCEAAGVPFLFKQWGDWAVRTQVHAERRLVGTPWQEGMPDDLADEVAMYRVGKKAAGRLLDGVLHDEFPAVGIAS